MLYGFSIGVPVGLLLGTILTYLRMAPRRPAAPVVIAPMVKVDSNPRWFLS